MFMCFKISINKSLAILITLLLIFPVSIFYCQDYSKIVRLSGKISNPNSDKIFIRGKDLPDGSAVKQFFLISYDFTFGSMNSDYLINLGVIVIDFGFILKFNVCSIIGFGIAYYLLKYFR
mgnify:CR=1 FL=1